MKHCAICNATAISGIGLFFACRKHLKVSKYVPLHLAIQCLITRRSFKHFHIKWQSFADLVNNTGKPLGFFIYNEKIIYKPRKNLIGMLDFWKREMIKRNG